jgi:hypothetical protein
MQLAANIPAFSMRQDEARKPSFNTSASSANGSYTALTCIDCIPIPQHLPGSKVSRRSFDYKLYSSLLTETRHSEALCPASISMTVLMMVAREDSPLCCHHSSIRHDCGGLKVGTEKKGAEVESHLSCSPLHHSMETRRGGPSLLEYASKRGAGRRTFLYRGDQKSTGVSSFFPPTCLCKLDTFKITVRLHH